MNPKVRIVMPIYNYQAYADSGIQSVLRQTDPNWELCIVDDGSSDKTPEICQRYAQQDSRIQFVQQKNEGQYNIVNRYTAEAETKYSAILDGDDRLAPDYIAAMHQFAEDHNCDITLTSHQVLQQRRYIHSRPQQVFSKTDKACLAVQFLHGVFPLPASGIFVRSTLRRKILPLMPQLPLYAATDDLQGFFLASHAERIGHIGSPHYWRNLASAGTWRNTKPEFRLNKVYSILFGISYMQNAISQWPLEQQAETASNYLLRWLRYNFLHNFQALEAKEQFRLLRAAIGKIHDLQNEIFISPQEQVAYLADMPYLHKEEWTLRHTLRDLLPYGYVSRKKRGRPSSQWKIKE